MDIYMDMSRCVTELQKIAFDTFLMPQKMF